VKRLRNSDGLANDSPENSQDFRIAGLEQHVAAARAARRNSRAASAAEEMRAVKSGLALQHSLQSRGELMDTSSVAALGTAPRRSRFLEAVADLIEGLKLWELWSTLGWHDIRQRYRRSIVGPFWLTLSMGIMVAGLAYLYGGLLGQNTEGYLAYVATGMIVFSLISSIAVEGSGVFIGSASLILQLRAPLSIYIYQMLWRNLLIFAHNISIYVVVLIFSKIDIGWNIFLAFVGLFLVLLNGVWVAVALGGLSARFRDVPPIVGSIMQVAFFLTPIFWTPGALPNRELFVHLNPFYYLVEIVRMPLLGKTPTLGIWLAVIGMNCVGALVAIVFYARYRGRIAYWV
jgi:ABC-2 type transport system permease protein/lipopolysaccharide transport system permease protein